MGSEVRTETVYITPNVVLILLNWTMGSEEIKKFVSNKDIEGLNPS